MFGVELSVGREEAQNSKVEGQRIWEGWECENEPQSTTYVELSRVKTKDGVVDSEGSDVDKKALIAEERDNRVDLVDRCPDGEPMNDDADSDAAANLTDEGDESDVPMADASEDEHTASPTAVRKSRMLGEVRVMFPPSR